MEELVIGVEEAVQIQEEQILQVQVEQKSKESSVQNEEVATVKDISEEVLKESRRIVDTLSKEEATLMVLLHKNAHANEMKKYDEGVGRQIEDHLEHEVRPDLYREHQGCTRVQMQVAKTGTFIAKLAAIAEDVEQKLEALDGERELLSKECEKALEEVKSMKKLMKVLSTEYDENMKLLRDEKMAIFKFHLETMKKLDDEILTLEMETEKTINEDASVKAEIANYEAMIRRQNEEKQELAAEEKGYVLELNALDAQLALFNSRQMENLSEDVELQNANAELDDLNKRLTTLKSMINDLLESISKNQNQEYNIMALQDQLAKLEKEKADLQLHDTETEKKVNEIKKLLSILHNVKQHYYLKSMEKLKKENYINMAKVSLDQLENQWRTAEKAKEEERTALESLLKDITDYKTQLEQQTTQFENDVATLKEDLARYTIDFKQKTEYKQTILKQQIDHQISQEENLKKKREENEKKKREIQRTKECLEKNEEEIKTKKSLKEKLEKEKAQLQNECDSKHTHSHQSTNENTPGILKSPGQPTTPKRVRFEALSPDVSSSEPSQNMDTKTLFSILFQSQPNNYESTKKRSRLSSP